MLPPLTPRRRELVAYILNSVAFGTHDDECELEAMAKKLGMQPGQLRAALSKLANQGYVTIEGTSAEWSIRRLRRYGGRILSWMMPRLQDHPAGCEGAR